MDKERTGENRPRAGTGIGPELLPLQRPRRTRDPHARLLAVRRLSVMSTSSPRELGLTRLLVGLSAESRLGAGNCAKAQTGWCRLGDSNTRPPHYECGALPAELRRPCRANPRLPRTGMRLSRAAENTHVGGILQLVSRFRSSPYHRYQVRGELRNQNDTRNQLVASVLSISKFAGARSSDVANFGIGTLAPGAFCPAPSAANATG